jgi:DNA-directed RNA polymerase subunit RPC12/RpoP
MTIEFNCPKCGALIAFDSQHSGRRARCLSCGQKFVIPAESFQKPEKVAPEPEPKGEPIPGFARAAFADTWKLLVHPKNVTPLAFVVAIVSFRFFLAQGVCCMNHISAIIIWGWLFGFYLNIIHQTAYDEDLLPEICLGTSVTFLWYVFQPFWSFCYTLILVEIPFFIAMSLTHRYGITFTNFGSAIGPLHLLVQFPFILGLFLFPAAILTTAVGKDYALLRPDYLLAPVFQAFFAYVAIVLMLAAACFLQMHASQYTGADPITTTLHLALNLLVQVIAIFAMRAIGLFYRHYRCYFKW